MLINELSSTISYYNTYFYNNKKLSSNLKISDIYDFKTDSSDFLTKGNILEISGTNLTINGENPIIGLYFINIYDCTKTIKLKKEELEKNSSELLKCQIPLSLTKGVYDVMIVTELNDTRKSIVSYIFDRHLFALK